MARKLGVTQGEIVRFLTTKNVQVEEGGNVKLGESQIRLLYAHFAPGQRWEDSNSPEASTALVSPASILPETVANIPDAEERRTAEPVTTPKEFVDPEPSVAGNSSPLTVPTSQKESEGESDVIRAPKIELVGLRVLGKIELPGPKKKDTPPTTETGAIDAGPAETEVSAMTATQEGGEQSPAILPAASSERPRRGNDQRRPRDERAPRRNQGRDQRSRVNPIAAQREREQQEELEKRKEKAAHDKERRTQNYNKRVKHSPPTKAMRLVEEPTEQLNESLHTEEPTTWFGKLVKWLRT